MYIQAYKIKIVGKDIEGEGFELIEDNKVVFTKAMLLEKDLSSNLLNDSIERISRILCNRYNMIGVVIKEGKPVAYDRKTFKEVY